MSLSLANPWDVGAPEGESHPRVTLYAQCPEEQGQGSAEVLSRRQVALGPKSCLRPSSPSGLTQFLCQQVSNLIP